MSKKTKVVTTTTDTAKRKSNESALVKKNLNDSAKQAKAEKTKPAPVATQREVKYNYPESCTSPDDRKEFRRKARATARKLDKKLAVLAKSEEPAAKKELKDTTKELQAWKQTTYSHAN